MTKTGRKPKHYSKEKLALEAFINRYSDSIEIKREFLFHPTRKWRFDYAMPHYRVAVEYEGGVFTGGGHTRGVIYSGNAEKYNEAQIMGWIVLRFTAPMIREKQHELAIFSAMQRDPS